INLESVELCHFVYPLHAFVFFFFQAEDGIRDATVTGVQTCALPISRSRTRLIRTSRPRSTVSLKVSESARSGCRSVTFVTSVSRSEERRVGKECRSRWSR